MAKKLQTKMVISWQMNELINKLHSEYPHTEWSGIARIEKRGWYYILTDIRFPKQKNVWTETEMEDLPSLLESIATEHPEQLHEWKCWLHSHHTMWCFRSGTDETTKRSFNDGNLDFRWSIVTAYTNKWPQYKCALNVFKPINIEFNVPVSVEEFNMQEYIKQFMLDTREYDKVLENITTEFNRSMAQYEQPFVASEQEVIALLNIMNVENTQENYDICKILIEKNSKDRIKKLKEYTIQKFEEDKEELLSYFNCDPFAEKLKELKDNIIKPAYGYDYWMHGYIPPTQQTPLFYKDIEDDDKPLDPYQRQHGPYF